MTDISIDRDAARWAAHLEDREKARSGHPLTVARQAVARRLKIPAGTLENLRRGRSKGVRAWIYETLRAEMVRELEQEKRRISHELEMVRQSSNSDLSVSIGEMEKRVAALKALVEEGKAS